ncbi:MAG: hypothetical protein MJY72_04335 [Bacteroidales bacterium]|nr:hypothetical protein [Bacteroidales bacterium]
MKKTRKRFGDMKIVPTFAVYYFTNTLRKMVTALAIGVAAALGIMTIMNN